MAECDNFQELIAHKNACLACGKLVALKPNERLDVALQRALPFSRSEIQTFMQQPCIALLDKPTLLTELQQYIDNELQTNDFAYLQNSEIQARQQALLSEFQGEIQLKIYKSSFKSKQALNFYCLPPANLSTLYQAEAEEIPLNIVYEDKYLLVINKPKGMVVHPAAGNWHGTLLNGLLYYLKDTHPYLVHRIDKDTSGLLVVAKTLEIQHVLQAELRKHSIQRTYQALAWGQISEEKFTIKGAIARDPSNPLRKRIEVSGKAAVTHAKLLEQFANFAYLELQLETGRTHQIRVHLAALAHPLVGDILYGGAELPDKATNGQCLHAVKLSFIHPVTKQLLEFSSPLPPYFQDLLDLARQGKI